MSWCLNQFSQFFSGYSRYKQQKWEIFPDWIIIWQGNVPNHINVTWREGEIAIAGIQPSFSPQERFVIVGDIWLSNRLQLLEQEKINPTKNDGEIIACLWERWGLDTLKYLEGMFAIAIWDREQGKLILIRDYVGSRTLYYNINGFPRYIAPRLRSLVPLSPSSLNLVALRDYLCCAFVPGEQTLWDNIRELRPGTYLKLPEVKIETYWEPKENIQNADQTMEWYSQLLRSRLENIIQEYLPSNQPVGVFLSGGIDSSCITALVKKFHNYPVHTFSIHFGSQYPHELEFANLVAQHCQTEHHILEIKPEQLWEQLPSAIAQLDDPIGEGLTVPNLLVGQFAKQFVDIVFNGEGGDPCFGGPKNQPMLLNSLYSSVTNRQDTDQLSAYLTSFKKCYPYLPTLLKPEIWAKVKDEPWQFTQDLNNSNIAYLHRLMLINIKIKGADYILTKVNNYTQAAGLSGRSPLFDRRIVELSLQIPPEYKLSGAEEKAVLKQAVRDLLPEIILQRPKSGMVMSMQQWFMQKWHQEARHLLLNKNAAIAPYLNQTLLKEWLEYRGQIWQRYGVLLWLLVTLEIWLQTQKSAD